METKSESIEIHCDIPVLCRILQRHALEDPDCIPLDKSEVIIKCRNDAKKVCDRSIIIAISEVLEEKLIKEENNPDEVALDISKEIVTTLLDCLTRIVELDFSQVIPLYAAAKRFGIHELSNGIKRRFTPQVCERFSRANGILDGVSDSDFPYISEFISGLNIPTMAETLLCQALLSLESRRRGRNESAFETICGILSAATKLDESPTPSTARYLRGKNGQLLRITGAQSDTYFGLANDPRKIPVNIHDNFVIKGDLCISIVKGDLEVRPLGMVPEGGDKRFSLCAKDLLGIDCSGSRIFVWSKHSVYSLKIEDGRPHREQLKSFDYKIDRVFAYTRDSNTCLAVLEGVTEKVHLHDSHMKEYAVSGYCRDPKAISNGYLVKSLEGDIEVHDLREQKYICGIPIESERSDEVDCIITESAIFVSEAVDHGTRIYKIKDGRLTSKIVLEGIWGRFVRVVE